MTQRNANENFKLLVTLTVAFDIIFILLHAIFGQYLGVFDLDKEQNLPTVYQGFKLFVIALMLGVASWKVRNVSSQSKLMPALGIMSLAFAYLSFDEVFIIHEQVELVSRALFPGITDQLLSLFFTIGFNSSVWLIFYIPAFVLGTIFMFYLKKLWPSFTNQQQKYMILGSILFGSVLIIEFINSRGVYSAFEYYLFTTLEEAIELFGATTFLYLAVLVAATNRKS